MVGDSLARGEVKALASWPFTRLCLIGFINSETGIMRPLLVGIFLNTVGLSIPRRKRYSTGTRDKIRCAPLNSPLPYMCHVYAYMCGICALKTSSRSFFSFWCLVVVLRALLHISLIFARFASHVVLCNNNLFGAMLLAAQHVLIYSHFCGATILLAFLTTVYKY